MSDTAPAAPAAPVVTVTPPAQVEPPKAETDWKAEARKWEDRAKENSTAAARLADIEKANQTELEKAVEKAKAEGRTEVQTSANARLVKAEARALAAAAKFRDPADAVAFLKLSDVKVSDDGEVDSAVVKTLLDDLAKEKPYLIDDGKPKPSGDAGQGPRPPATSTDPRAQDLAQIEADIQAGKRR